MRRYPSFCRPLHYVKHGPSLLTRPRMSYYPQHGMAMVSAKYSNWIIIGQNMLNSRALLASRCPRSRQCFALIRKVFFMSINKRCRWHVFNRNIHDQKSLSCIYRRLNNHFFGGTLPEQPITWNTELHVTGGRMLSHGIELYPGYPRFEAVLLREMVRCWSRLTYGCSSNSFPFFIQKCLELKAPLNIWHYPDKHYFHIKEKAYKEI